MLPRWSDRIIAYLYDGFERANQTGLGQPVTGTAWTIYGPGALSLAQIENGAYTGGPPVALPARNLVYAATFVHGTPGLFGAEFSFVTTTNSGGDDGVIAILSSSDPPPGEGLWQNILHLVISRSSWILTVYRNGVPHLLTTGTSSGALNLVADGRKYQVYLMVKGDTVQLYLPSGEVVQACDADVSKAHGNQLIYEHVYSSQSPHYGRFEAVSAFIDP